MIKGEDTFLVGYVIFDKRPGFAEVDVVESAARLLQDRIASGELVIPPGVRYRFTGTYENQVRAQKTLRVVIPVSLALIFLFIYLEFRRVSATLMVFAGVFTAWSGGFLLLWLYGQPWFLDFDVFGVSMRNLFQVHPVNLSVAVWVGFLALFGIATDDGVLMGTYLKQRFAEDRPTTRAAARDTAVAAAMLRNRPAVTTTITTLLALLPVLTSDGRGAEVMVPMAIPTFGGMILSTIDVFLVPVLFCWREERRLPAG
jgi:Cu(I)/Ag(I) efflux system membrane protein CusA/SilA